MNGRRLKVVLALVLFALGTGTPIVVVAGPSFGGGKAAAPYTETAALGTVSQRVTGSGSLSAMTTYGLRFGGGPDIVKSASTSSAVSAVSGPNDSSVEWPVKVVSATVGEQVKKGDVLAVADDTAAQRTVAVDAAALANAQAKLDADRGGPDASTKADAQDQLNQAKERLAQATASQKTTRSQNDLSLQQATAAVTAAQQQLKTDKAAGAPQAKRDADNAAIKKAKDDLASAKLRVQQSNQQAAQQVTSAQLAVTSAQHAYDAKTAASTPAVIQADEAAVARAQADLDTAKAIAAASSLVAPADGVVSAVNIAPGANAPSGAAIQIEAGPMVATLSLAETNVPSLQLGQAATITVSAAGVNVNGTVSGISQTATTSGGGGSSVVAYTVKVTLDPTPATVFSGMAASVAITTAEAQNVVSVSASAVKGSASSGYSVTVLDSTGAQQPRTVQVGLVTSSRVEIKSGLSAGELVVLQTTATGTSTTNQLKFPVGDPVIIPDGKLIIPEGGAPPKGP